MIAKKRLEPSELLYYKMLDRRKSLPQQLKQQYANLAKGYQGESTFDSMTEELSNGLILNDLCLQANRSTFQIDALMIFQDEIHLFEIKNFDGDYVYHADKFYKRPKSEIVNPIHQLGRTEALLRQALNSLRCNLPIHSSVVFINPQFTMYQTPLDKPFIFPGQIKKHLAKLQAIPSQVTNKHKELAKQLISMHVSDSHFRKLSYLSEDRIKKGIICSQCFAFFEKAGKKYLTCDRCHHKETVDQAVVRAINEYSYLFPNEKVTTNKIYNWCEIIFYKRIKTVLTDHYKQVGERRWAHYVRR